MTCRDVSAMTPPVSCIMFADHPQTTGKMIFIDPFRRLVYPPN